MKNKLKILDLFSGIGGFSLGLERTGQFKTVAFCEIDQYCKLLLQKHWKGVKIYNDVKEITQEGFKADGIESPDIITGGFPCQPFSVAGKQKGTSDNRHLWPEMFRIIKAFKPRFVIGENVRGIINIQDGVVFEAVCTDLESEGYEVQPFIIPAAGVGAPHRRERVWIIATLADANESNSRERKISRDIDNEGRRASETRRESLQSEDRQTRTDNLGSGSEDVENSRRTLRQGTELRKENEDEIERKDAHQHQRSSSSSESDVADTSSGRSASQEREIQTGRNSSQHQGWWDIEPDVGRVAHGVSGRVHRLKGLGNSIVPQIAEEIGKAIINMERR